MEGKETNQLTDFSKEQTFGSLMVGGWAWEKETKQ